MKLFRNLIKLCFGNRGDTAPIIIVSGLPRSGTSLMMQMLEAGGAQLITDNIRKADRHNQRGYYELEAVKRIQKNGTPFLNNASGRVIKVISALLKFLPQDKDYKVIFMTRDIDEILRSQSKMINSENGTIDPGHEAKMKEKSQAHLDKTLIALSEYSHMFFLIVEYKELIENPLNSTNVICDFLELDLDRKMMAHIIDPDLYHQRM